MIILTMIWKIAIVMMIIIINNNNLMIDLEKHITQSSARFSAVAVLDIIAYTQPPRQWNG